MSITVKASSTYSRTVSLDPSNHGIINGFIAALDSTGRLYVHGGVGSASAFDTTQRALERYDPSSDAWSTLAASAQFQTGTAYIVDSSDRLIYATGVVEGPSAFTYTDRGEIYDPSANTWTSLPHIDSGSVATGDRDNALFWKDPSGRLNILGGRAGSTTGFTSQDGTPYGIPVDGWRYSGGSTGTWTQLGPFSNWPTTNPMSQRAGSTQTTLLDGSGNPWKIFGDVADGGALNCAYMNLSTSTRVVTSSLPSGQDRSGGSAASAFAPSGTLYTAGGQRGFPNLSIYHATTWKYDIGTDTWTQLANMPRAVAYGQMVYFGGYLYYIGGLDGSSRYSQILRYDPAGDTWTDNTDNLSVARAFPSVVGTLDGTGFWLYSGNTAGSATSGFSNVLELWVPELPAAGPVTTHPRAFAQVIGD